MAKNKTLTKPMLEVLKILYEADRDGMSEVDTSKKTHHHWVSGRVAKALAARNLVEWRSHEWARISAAGRALMEQRKTFGDHICVPFWPGKAPCPSGFTHDKATWRGGQ